MKDSELKLSSHRVLMEFVAENTENKTLRNTACEVGEEIDEKLAETQALEGMSKHLGLGE